MEKSNGKTKEAAMDKANASKLRFAYNNAAKFGLDNNLLHPNRYNPLLPIPPHSDSAVGSGTLHLTATSNESTKVQCENEVLLCPETGIPDVDNIFVNTSSKVDFGSQSISQNTVQNGDHTEEPKEHNKLHSKEEVSNEASSYPSCSLQTETVPKIQMINKDNSEDDTKLHFKSAFISVEQQSNINSDDEEESEVNEIEETLPTQKKFSVEKTEKRKQIRKVVRKSEISDQYLKVSNTYFGLQEIQSIAAVVFMETYKGVEGLLELDGEVKICPDYKEAFSRPRYQLSKNYHTNFEFSLRLGETEMRKDRIGPALSYLRRMMNSHYYPDARDMHTILFTLTKIADQRTLFNRSFDFLYQVLAVHPPCTSSMRDFYMYIITSKCNDGNCWTYFHELLQGVINSEDGNECSIQDRKSPTEEERIFNILCFLVKVVEEDLHCWLLLTANPAGVLRVAENVPLIAKILWNENPDQIGHVNDSCRELITLHMLALKKNHSAALSATKALIKLLAAMTKLRELQLPLTMCLPGKLMENLALEILLLIDEDIVIENMFFSSFGLPELALLLSLNNLKRLKPNIPVLDKCKLSLNYIITCYQEISCNDETIDYPTVINTLLLEPKEIKISIFNALHYYNEMFCLTKTWVCLAQKSNSGIFQFQKTRFLNVTATPVHSVFSQSFPLSHFCSEIKRFGCFIATKCYEKMLSNSQTC